MDINISFKVSRVWEAGLNPKDKLTFMTVKKKVLPAHLYKKFIWGLPWHTAMQLKYVHSFVSAVYLQNKGSKKFHPKMILSQLVLNSNIEIYRGAQ